jgi:hypothetical protein
MSKKNYYGIKTLKGLFLSPPVSETRKSDSKERIPPLSAA